MVCSVRPDPPDDSQAGFATPAAAAICLALATTIAAVMTMAATAQRAAARDLRRTQSEFFLAGARLMVAQTLIGSSNVGRVRWTLSAPGEDLEVVAEPEAAKLSLGQAASRAGPLGAMLSAITPGSLSSTLQGLVARPVVSAGDIANADASPAWRLCARSLISRDGQATDLPSEPPAQPMPGPTNWRAGQLWRFRITDPEGWTDDSVVRLTGDSGHPIAVVSRRFTHSGPMGDRCGFIAQNLPAR